MTPDGMPRRSTRTLFGQVLRDQGLTPEEFSQRAECFAREHGLTATLSPRHVQRLAAGRHSDGRPLGPLRPATQRLLELMLDRPVAELLGPPKVRLPPVESEADELRAAIARSARVDAGLVRTFQRQLDSIRQVDRRLGATEVLSQLRDQIKQMSRLLTHSLAPEIRRSLAAVLVDACTLAGWQSMDQGELIQAWMHYREASLYAHESGSGALLAYATAAQAILLLDVEQYEDAVRLIEVERAERQGSMPSALLAWLNGAAGEVYAANKRRDDSLRAFDAAECCFEGETVPAELPFVLLDTAHLSRWRGTALVRLGSQSATTVLSSALATIDPTFSRAEVSIHLDLAEALANEGDTESALAHAERARTLVAQTGSVRLDRRRDRIVGALTRS